ncbi:MAG TPA: lysyl oxidase family protein [Polyangiaceae bacterium]|nr:lysyl oxidase family protein [Polyangiaceae bacterium]
MQIFRPWWLGLLAGLACACGGDDNPGAAAKPPSSLEPAPEGPRPGSAASGPLPDLVLDAAYLLDTTVLDTVNVEDPCSLQEQCVTGLGQRRVVRFGSRMGNIGNADFVLGDPDQDNPLWTFDTCQMSFNLVGFSRYELRDAASGESVLRGTKRGFCISDPEPWIPESGALCEQYDCNHQGISPGCADNYGSSLPCQWVDVTGIPSGSYELEVGINSDRQVAEQDYANNVVTLRLQLTEDDIQVGF